MSSENQKACFSVNIDEYGCIQADWSFEEQDTWTVSQKVGVRWESESLTEEGRQAILAHFHLTEVADELPMDCLRVLSPHNLQLRRQAYEKGHRVNTPNLDPHSQRRGFESIRASQVL
ncbi:MAG: hypothetical protein ACJKSS_03330 [Patescibacteria group bacterium UBA2103]